MYLNFQLLVSLTKYMIRKYKKYVIFSGGSRIRPKGGVDFVNGGRGGRESLQVLKVESKVIFSVFGHISSKIMLNINRERSERRIFF